MKNAAQFLGIIALAAVIGFSMAGCENPTDPPKDKNLSGTVSISPSADVKTGTKLTASYSGHETVTLAWQWKKDGGNVGTNSNEYTPTEAGSYTVTASAKGYKSKPSAAVTVSTGGIDPTAILTGITAEYESDNPIYPDTTLQTLKGGLTVTAHYSDSTSKTLAAEEYELSGELAAGNSEITVMYQGKEIVFTVTVNAAHEHNWNKLTVRTAATCTAPGEETWRCSASPTHDETREIPIDPTAHNWQPAPSATAPTCTEDGNGDQICAYNATHIQSGTIPKLGHDYQNYSQTTAPTCTTGGVETGTCTHDPTHKDTRPIAIDPDAHDWDGWTVTIDSTFTTEGLEAEICKHNPSHINSTRPIPQIPITNTTDFTTILTSLPTNTANTPFTIVLNISDLTSVANAITDSQKYVKLDLSSSTFTSIGSSAFWYCRYLTGINLPDNVTNITEGAFGGCFALTTIDVGSGNATYSSESGILYNKNKTTLISCPAGKTGSVTIPESVENISGSAFSFCNEITDIIIGNSVTSIGGQAFFECTSLTSIFIPDSVTSIGIVAFDECNNLTTIDVGSGNAIYSSESGILYNKNKSTLISYPAGKTDVVTISNNVTNIAEYAFFRIYLITSVTIPNSVNSIGSYAFSSCSRLTNVMFEGTVSTFGYNAFDGDFVSVYNGSGTYTRQENGQMWTKQ